jgi:hypothetical protein
MGCARLGECSIGGSVKLLRRLPDLRDPVFELGRRLRDRDEMLVGEAAPAVFLLGKLLLMLTRL